MRTREDRAIARLAARFRDHDSRAVVYRRGAQAVPWRATVGESQYGTEAGDGFVVEYVGTDFIGPSAELSFGAGPIEPRRGDLIEDTVEGVTRVYEVLAPGSAMVFRYLGSRRELVRIHTKETQQRN